jgi:hypothetical protein
MVRVDVSQQCFFFGELLVTMSAQDWLQLQMNRSQMSVQVACNKIKSKTTIE